MKNAIASALILLLLTLSGGAALLAWDLHCDLLDAGSVLQQASTTLSRVDATTDRADQVLSTVHDAAQQLNAAEAEQLRYVSQAERQGAGSAKAARLFLDRTDHSLNDVLLPHLDSTITQLGQAGAASLGALGNAGAELSQAGQDLDTQLKDPQIEELVGHLNVTSQHLAAISANSEAMSADMKLAVHRMAAPPSKWHTFLDMSYTTAKFGSLFLP